MLKRYYKIFFLFLPMALIAYSPQQTPITKTLKAEKGGTLEVKLNPGDVNIKMWDRNEVLVKIDGLDENEAEELKITQRGGNVKVSYEGEWGWGISAKYYFTIPSSYNVDVYTTGGDVVLYDNLNGNLNIQTMGGDIETMSISGDASVETMGGDIKLGDVGGISNISTQGGDIEAGKLSGRSREIKTMGGDITINTVADVKKITTYGGDISISEVIKNAELTTFGGDIVISRCKEGIKADTYGGSIIISGANGFVEVSSGGGNITLSNIVGAVHARTGAGNIEVELKSVSGKDSDIRTGAGDINFSVLQGSKMNINARVDSYRRDAQDLIKSDFEGNISKNRGDFEGKFNINGGGAEVNLRVTNGTISIKKK